jgi:ATP-dependent Zn protease
MKTSSTKKRATHEALASLAAEPDGMTAIHETGHALAAMAWCKGIEYVTIEPRANDLGHCREWGWTLEEIKSQPPQLRTWRHQKGLAMVRYALAGRAAEHVATNAPHDEIQYLVDGGWLSELCLAALAGPPDDMQVANDYIFAAFPRTRRGEWYVVREYRAVHAALVAGRDAVANVAGALLQRRTMDHNEVLALMGGRELGGGK